MKRSLSPLARACRADDSTAMHAQAMSKGLAQLVPNTDPRRNRPAGRRGPGIPTRRTFHLWQSDIWRFTGEPHELDGPAIRAVEAFGDRLRAQFANFPLGSSTGGFTYSFNEQSGLYTRNTQSFGPAFTERAATIGRRKFSLGVNYQHTSFDTFGGQDLQDGSIPSIFRTPTAASTQQSPPPSPQTPGFESDLMQATLTLKATTDTVGVFANYGVTDRFDVGIAIPISHVSLDANVHATILRLSSGRQSCSSTPSSRGRTSLKTISRRRARRRALVTWS